MVLVPVREMAHVQFANHSASLKGGRGISFAAWYNAEAGWPEFCHAQAERNEHAGTGAEPPLLTITRAQMRVLSAPFLERFVRHAISHVATHFGEQSGRLGEAVVRDAVLHAIERAECHGLTTNSAILTYLTLMFCFGRDFDQDSLLPWAAEALYASGEAAGIRLSRLQALALAHQGDGRGYLAGNDPHDA
jgi:hypothetical protein